MEENGIWDASLVYVLELVMDLTELSLYYCHNLLGLLGRRVWCHRWAMSSALLRLGAPVAGEEAVRRLGLQPLVMPLILLMSAFSSRRCP